MAAAVLRPRGSRRTRWRAAAGSCFFRVAACSALVTVQRRCGGMRERRRATVCWSMVSLPKILRSCLGVLVRLRGQKRVPRPPARMTAWVVRFSEGMARPGTHVTKRMAREKKNLSRLRQAGAEFAEKRPQRALKRQPRRSRKNDRGKLRFRDTRTGNGLSERGDIRDVGTQEAGPGVGCDRKRGAPGRNEPALTQAVRGFKIFPGKRPAALEHDHKREAFIIVGQVLPGAKQPAFRCEIGAGGEKGIGRTVVCDWQRRDFSRRR